MSLKRIVLERLRSVRYFGVLLAISLFAIFMSGSSVHAAFRVCNKTSNRVGVVIGYRDASSPPKWVTEGWWNLVSNSCATLVNGPLSSRFYYLYAVDYEEGGEWSGRSYMCTREKTFTIEGIGDCVKRGYERTGFKEIDTGEHRNWSVNLIMESGYTLGSGN